MSRDVIVFDGPEAPVTVVTDETGGSVLVLTGGRGPAGPAGVGLPTFCQGGLLHVRDGDGWIYNPTTRALRLTQVRVSVVIPAVGGWIEAELLMDGIPLGLTLVLPEGEHTVTLACDVTWPVNSYLSVNVTRVGDEFPGDTLQYQVTAA